MSEPRMSPGIRVLLVAAALVIVIGGIYRAQSVLASFLVAVFLTLLGTPAVLWLERKRTPSVVAVLVVVTGMIVTLLVVGGLVGVSLNGFVDTLPSYQERLDAKVSALEALLATKGFAITDKMLHEYVNPGAVVKLAVGMLGRLGAAVSNVVLILLTVTFILLEASSFPVKLRVVLGHPKQAFPQFTGFVDDMTRYMIIKTVISLAAGVAIGLWLWLLGVDSPVLWGFLAFLLHYVPNVGFVIAALPAVVLTFVQLGIGHAALAAAGYLVVGFTLGNVVEPRLMGGGSAFPRWSCSCRWSGGAACWARSAWSCACRSR